ncbi:hypothetical protein D3C76_1617460 [compost metagenome]
MAVMTANPGKIKEIVNVGLPRPRRVGDVLATADFSLIRYRIWELLQNTPGTQAPVAAVRPAETADIRLSEQISTTAVL